MVQIRYMPAPPGAARQPANEAKIRQCIDILVEGKLKACRCPNGCPKGEVRVDIRGDWREGQFEAHVTKACCAGYVMTANDLLSKAPPHRPSFGLSAA